MIRKTIRIFLLTAVLFGTIYSAVRAEITPAYGPSEIYRRFGAYIAGPLDVTQLSGRPQTPAAVIQTGSGVGESYYVFPAFSTFQVVDGAKFYILGRTGDYSGEVQMSLDVYGIDGSYKRTISNSIDLIQPSIDTWLSLDLSGHNTSLSPYELLVVHFVYSNGSGGSLDIRPIFEIKAFSGFRAFLALIRR